MKKRYNKFWLFFALAFVLMWSCEKDYEAPTGEPNHEYVTTKNGNQAPVTMVGLEYDFIDLSRGVVTREWIFPDNITDIVGSENDKTSDKAVVKAIFSEAGPQEVTLNQTYGGNVYVQYDSLTDKNTYDTTIVVNVLDSIRPNFTARRLRPYGYPFKVENGAKNLIPAGRIIEFTQACSGPPSAFSWAIIYPNDFVRVYDDFTDSTIQHRFGSLGLYHVALLASHQFHDSMIVYQDLIEVIASTEPLEQISITSETKEEVIKITYDRDLMDVTTCPLEAFNLIILNQGAAVDYLNIKALSQDPLEGNVVLVELDGPVYNSDQIYISYDATVGDLSSVDSFAVESFDTIPVAFENKNLLPSTEWDYSFENITIDYWRTAFWGTPFTTNYMTEITEGVATHGLNSGYFNVPADSGSTTMLWQTTGSGGADDNNKDDYAVRFQAPGGEYEIKVDVLLESAGSIKPDGNSPDLRFYIDPGFTEVFIVKNMTLTPDDDNNVFPGEQTGVWKTITTRANITGGDNMITIRVDNQGGTAPLKFRLDNISFSPLDKRPEFCECCPHE